jgi:hypothetical protein
MVVNEVIPTSEDLMESYHPHIVKRLENKKAAQGGFII